MSNFVPVIDVSHHQGALDLARAARAGVAGVMCRAGNGRHGDDRFASNVAAARAAGLPVGAYWFCNPKADADGGAQANRAAAVIARTGVPLDLPMMLDIEWYQGESGSNPVLSGPPLAAWLRSCVQAVQVATGRPPIVYSSATYWNNWVGADDFGHLDIILARYPVYSLKGAKPPAPPGWSDWAFGKAKRGPALPMGWRAWAGWQFSAGFNQQGPAYGAASRDLDLNVVRGDAWSRWTGSPRALATPAGAAPAIDPQVEDLGADPPAGLLQFDSRGQHVRALQVRLYVYGFDIVVDGWWAAQTNEKLHRFQAMKGLAQTDSVEVGDASWEALMGPPARLTLRAPATGPTVAIMQRLLGRCGHPIGVDGVMGAGGPTDTTLRAFQLDVAQHHEAGFPVDGVCGMRTWAWLDRLASA